MIHSLSINSTRHEELIDITAQVKKIIDKGGVKSGVCFLYTPHTTAALTINENADPSVRKDILTWLESLKLENMRFSHLEGNSPAHIKSSLIGCSLFVLIEDGRLQLGTWQGIYFCEFDGPRTRSVMVRLD